MAWAGIKGSYKPVHPCSLAFPAHIHIYIYSVDVDGDSDQKLDLAQLDLSEIMLKDFLCNIDCCRLLIIFANSLELDQDRQSVGPDVDPNHLKL